ncbi:bifunctional diguanylate cyclase/phosphodiesterase [Cognatiluteimonas profundi]|uniref:bifunctional diguanylate cyclase/phosphodiesterase n=1 Tax=Cognatiluteimonas profundi TaxID=2594501 RepID=UPI00131AF988|nr:EAL domain-containing protein [Lysobacter profundi]
MGQRMRWWHQLRNEFPAALLATTAFFGLSVTTSLFAWRPDSVSALRLGGALLLGVMLRRQPRAAAAAMYLLLGLAAMTIAQHVTGRPWSTSLLLGGARLLELGLAYGLLRKLGEDGSALQELPTLGRLMLVTVFVAPMVGTSLVALIVNRTYGTPFLPALQAPWVGNAFGMVVFLPLVLAATRERATRLIGAGRRLELALIAMMTLLVCVSSVLWTTQPFVLILLPLLLAAFRLRVLGTALLGFAATMSVLVLERFLLTHPGALPVFRGDRLGFTEVAFYSCASILAPLLVSVQQERRAAEARALKRAREHLQTVIDNVPALIGNLDTDRRYRFVNREYEEWFGRPASEFIGRTTAEMLGDEQAAQLSGPVAQALAGQAVHFDAAVAGREASIVYVPEMQDGCVQGVFVLANDVSERKKAERALFEEKQRMQVTLESIGDAVVVCDTGMCITLLNPVAEAMTGWPESEAVGRPVDEVIRLVDMARGETPLSPLRIAIRDNRVVALQTDTALLRRNGVETPIEDSAAPIRDSDGNVVGGVMVFRDVSELRTMALKMSHLAQHDYLTDLPNRVLLHDRLSHALASTAGGFGPPGALMFLDLDHFKTINDSLGHQVGDQVLQEVSRRLLASVREDDTVSRQGGDEFVILLERLGDPRDAARVAQKMLHMMRAPIQVDGHLLHLSLSIGISLFPQDSNDAQALMMQADTALYHAKQSGRDQFSYFSNSMSEKAAARLKLENDLRDALRDGELCLVYQPKVMRPEQRITGMEALVRWRRKDGDLGVPADFIPVAEESGLITQLDEWVMHEACRQNRAWQLMGLPSVPVSVNVSLARFDPERLLAHVAEALQRSGLAAEDLQIEFTESQMFCDEGRARTLIEGLHALGVRIALDDFGTGYSSLRYLLQYRFNTLKIDRSFVSGLPADEKQVAVVRAVVAMARALQADVVAEGVETIAQAEALEQHDCLEVQGFLYSHPVAPDVMALLLARPSLQPRPRDRSAWPT